MNMEVYQHTLKDTVSFSGVGLHSGKIVNLTVKPASEDHGIRFKLTGQAESMPASHYRVVDTSLATTIAENDMLFSTTEHLLAALSGLGIDNAVIELDGSEVPIMDGSAAPFVTDLRKAKRVRQNSCKKVLKITKPITIQDGDKVLTIEPYDGLKLSCEINFNHKFLQKQEYSIELSPERFSKEIASARTFGFVDQVEQLKASGYALGGSLDNAVVIDENGVINTGGLRFADEFVRHKVLDLLGDLALLGCTLMGHVTAKRSGHGQHLALMQEIAKHPDCWEMVERVDQKTKKTCTRKSAKRGKSLPFFLNPDILLGNRCPVAA